MMKSASAGNSPADDNRETYNGNSYDKLQENFKWTNRYLSQFEYFIAFLKSFRVLELLCETYKEEYTTTFKDLESYKTEIVNLRKQLGATSVGAPFFSLFLL